MTVIKEADKLTCAKKKSVIYSDGMKGMAILRDFLPRL